jgi:cold shock CspA family protein
MAKSQDTFNKKEKEKKRLKKRQEKNLKREDRKSNSSGGELENMLAYVDENGNLTDTPPDPSKKRKVIASSIEISVPRREEEEVIAVRTGRVEFFNDSKGFGFIKESETQEKYFVHVNGLLETIKENDMVTFELERGLKGLNAICVKKVVPLPKISKPINTPVDTPPETTTEVSSETPADPAVE